MAFVIYFHLIYIALIPFLYDRNMVRRELHTLYCLCKNTSIETLKKDVISDQFVKTYCQAKVYGRIFGKKLRSLL